MMLVPLLALSFPVLGGAAPLTDDDFDPERIAESWEPLIAGLDVVGVGVALVVDGRPVVVRGYGHGDSERKRAVDSDTYFYIASSTKSFAALSMLLTAEAEELDHRAPVSRMLPRFALADGSAAPSLHDLLCHSAGLRGDLPISLHEAFTGIRLSDDFFYSRVSQYVTRTDGFAYGNFHYSLAARALEAATERDWRAHLRATILEPAGLRRTTTLASHVREDGNFAELLVQDEAGDWSRATPKVDGSMGPGGGVYASAADLGRWIALNSADGKLDGEQVVPASAVRATRAPHAEVGTSFMGSTGRRTATAGTRAISTVRSSFTASAASRGRAPTFRTCPVRASASRSSSTPVRTPDSRWSMRSRATSMPAPSDVRETHRT